MAKSEIRPSDTSIEELAIFSSFLDIQKYSAMINVGGGVASLGTSFNSKLLKAGIVNAGKTLPMLSAIDAIREKLIEPVFIGDEKNTRPK